MPNPMLLTPDQVAALRAQTPVCDSCGFAVPIGDITDGGGHVVWSGPVPDHCGPVSVVVSKASLDALLAAAEMLGEAMDWIQVELDHLNSDEEPDGRALLARYHAIAPQEVK